MTICVTGGAGFIGSAVVSRLLARRELVRVFDNFSRGQHKQPGAAYYEGDICDSAAVYDAARGCEEIIHLAYINGTPTFYSDPGLVLEVGVKGMVNLIDACNAWGIKKFTLMSSSEVARVFVPGEQTPLVIPDPFNPRYSYSAGKIISEMMAIHCGLFDRLLILRPFNVYGPGMAKGHVVPDFITRMRKIRKADLYPAFEILGSGSETRSFCYIDDFVDGFMLVRDGGEHRGIYNIGNPDEISILGLAERIAGLMGVRPLIEQKHGLREGEIARRKPDISKLQALGYQPKISLDEGLGRTIRAMSVVPEYEAQSHTVAWLYAAGQPDADGGRGAATGNVAAD